MDTHESYVSLETAKLLKKAGFDWEYHKRYTPDGLLLDYPVSDEDFLEFDEVFAPSLDVAQRWLREAKNYHVGVEVDCDSSRVFYTVRYVFHDGNNYNRPYIWEKDERGEDNHHRLEVFNTYEEAQEAGIKKALEIILEKGE